MALAANRRNFTPPRRIRQMEDDLRLLPLVWTDADDEQVGVWGWNLAVREQLARRGVARSVMPGDDELALWRTMSHRAFAVSLMNDFQNECGKTDDGWVGDEMCFVKRLDDVPFAADEMIIVKQPFSSSGRGNLVGRLADAAFAEKVGVLMQRHDGLLVDRYYQKVLDFALEFHLSREGEVVFLGHSVFETSQQGRYGGNVVASQQELRQRIAAAWGHSVEDVDKVGERWTQLLSTRLAGRYYGPLGIDLMVVEDKGKRKVHPCVEVNLRMNMGIAALRLYERLQLLSRMVADGATYNSCVQNGHLRFMSFLPEADFSRFHFDDLNSLLRSSMRLPLSPIRDCGFQAFLESGRLCIDFS